MFFSILSCIAQSGSFSELGRIGGRLITSFIVMTTIAAFTGTGISLLLKPGSGIVISSVANVSVAPAEAVSFGDIIMNIVPSNFVQPFLKMDMLQIMFLAAICGAGLNMMDDSAKQLKDICASLSKLFVSNPTPKGGGFRRSLAFGLASGLVCFHSRIPLFD